MANTVDLSTSGDAPRFSCLIASQKIGRDDAETAFHQHTMLISFEGVELNRRRARRTIVRPLPGTALHKQIRNEEELDAALESVSPGFACCVISVPAAPQLLADPDAPRRTLKALRSSPHHLVTTIAGACMNPGAWAGRFDVDGWVTSPGRGNEANTAHALFTVFASLVHGAPDDVDEGAIVDILGSPEMPARLVSARWLTRVKRLRWGTDTGLVAFTSAKRAMVVIDASHDHQRSATYEIYQHLRGLLPHRSSLTTALSSIPLAHHNDDTRRAPAILILCR